MKNYIITGAAGHLGSTILRLLEHTDCRVTALILPGEQPVVEGENIRYVRGDVCKSETLGALFGPEDGPNTAVIHAAGLISISRWDNDRMHAVNVEGTRNMLRVSEEKKAGCFVYVSSVHAIPELPVGELMGEVERFCADAVEGGYARTKALASQLVLDYAADGLPAVVVHPSGLIGPYDDGHNHLVQLVRDYMDGRLSVCVKGGYDFADVRDVARGCLLAAQKGRSGQCYILSGQYLSIRELLCRVGEIVGKKPPLVVPMALARLAAPLIEGWAKRRGTRPLYTRYSLYALTSNSNFSGQKARTELGYCPRSIDETIRDTVRWLEKA